MPNIDGVYLARRLYKSALSGTCHTHYSDKDIGHFAGNENHDWRDLLRTLSPFTRKLKNQRSYRIWTVENPKYANPAL